MFDAEHATLQGEEFAVGRGTADVRETSFIAHLQSAGESVVVGTGWRVQLGHGVCVNGRPARVGLIIASRLGAHLGSC